jgi:tripartite-type tricarboxylate transporter receptor subunit TctC
MRERPGKNAYGTAGSGGTQHILSEAFRRAMGIDAIHAPYKGEAPLVADFLGGRLDWYIATPITILPHVQSGKVRVLAVTGDDRIGLFPEAPTFREAGVPQMNAVGWYGVFAPANTPAPIVDRLSKEIVAIVKQPDIVEYLIKNGLVQTGYDAGEFAKRLPAFRQTFRSMIRENNIKVD